MSKGASARSALMPLLPGMKESVLGQIIHLIERLGAEVTGVAALGVVDALLVVTELTRSEKIIVSKVKVELFSCFKYNLSKFFPQS